MLKKFLIDVDGVLTTGQFLYSEEGKIFKIFGPHDSDGLKLIKQDIDISFISADKRGFEISKKRVEDMGFSLVYCSEQDRKIILQKIIILKIWHIWAMEYLM